MSSIDYFKRYITEANGTIEPLMWHNTHTNAIPTDELEYIKRLQDKVTQLSKENVELQTKFDYLASEYNKLLAEYIKINKPNEHKRIQI